jgi:hypothetical protein
MAKPFQLSMRRMLFAVLLWCLAMRLGVLSLATIKDSGPWPPVVFFASFATVGAAIGCVVGRPFKGILCGLLVAFLLLLALTYVIVNSKER